MWPFCTQPLYATAMPLMFNATILNGQGLTGALEGAPVWTPADEGGRLLDVQVRCGGGESCRRETARLLQCSRLQGILSPYPHHVTSLACLPVTAPAPSPLPFFAV